LLRPEKWVAEKIDVLRDPQHPLGLEPLPAVGACYLREKLDLFQGVF
jgi:hypothetical protein